MAIVNVTLTTRQQTCRILQQLTVFHDYKNSLTSLDAMLYKLSYITIIHYLIIILCYISWVYNHKDYIFKVLRLDYNYDSI